MINIIIISILSWPVTSAYDYSIKSFFFSLLKECNL